MKNNINRVQRFAANTKGRDFVVGDIHGCYEMLDQALAAVNFQPETDRLFSIGDLVDRGPQSPRVGEFLARPWVHAIKGNHEELICSIYEDGEADPAVVRAFCRMNENNGMMWWVDVPADKRLQIVEQMEQLPNVIELETPQGLIGLVHAEVEQHLDWPRFISLVESGDPEVLEAASWGRERYKSNDCSGVSGIHAVVVGHTPHANVTTRGNVVYIDTGAFFEHWTDGRRKGQLTVLNIAELDLTTPFRTEVAAA